MKRRLAQVMLLYARWLHRVLQRQTAAAMVRESTARENVYMMERVVARLERAS